MDDDLPDIEEEGGGSPAWMATFADLMSLLMCFFVLLLAFSEMDVLKFKQLAGSMREAFGVQRDIKAMEMPKGTSIIAQEFSPGRPSPTPVVELRQFTTEETKENLDFGDLTPRADKIEVDKEVKEKKKEEKKEEKKKQQEENLDDIKKALQDQIRKLLARELQKLKSLLSDDIKAGTIELESQDREIVIRIREKGSFRSGSAQLQKSFYPILGKIGTVLKEVDGSIVVSGHTDNLPIFTSQYPSNWVLSAARAASVVHYLTTYSKVKSDRIEIRAYGDIHPVDSNKTVEGRAKNRRVEISVRFGGMEAIDSGDLQAVLEADRTGGGGDDAPSDDTSNQDIVNPPNSGEGTSLKQSDAVQESNDGLITEEAQAPESQQDTVENETETATSPQQEETATETTTEQSTDSGTEGSGDGEDAKDLFDIISNYFK